MSTHRLAVREVPGEFALTALRCVAGIVMAAHGWAKLMDVSAWQAQLESLAVPAPEVMSWLAIAGELLGGLGLALGLLTPVAAFGIVAVMVTAIGQVHWGNGLFASEGGMELPLLMLCVAFTFMLRGAGPFSLDALIKSARRRHPWQHSADQPGPTVPREPGEHGAHWAPGWRGPSEHAHDQR